MSFAQKINRPNSKKKSPMKSPTVETYPSAGGRHEGSQVRLPREENAQRYHQHLFEENVRKTKSGSTNFKYEKVRKLFSRTGKVLAPHASVTKDGSF